MPKFKIDVEYNGVAFYIVEATSEEEATKKLGEGDFLAYDNDYHGGHDYNEEVINIERI